MDEFKLLLTSFFGAFIVGWFGNLVALVTDPIISASNQALIKLGWVGVFLVVAVVIKQTYDDLKGYMAMGVFAIFAIGTLFLPFDLATILFFISSVSLCLIDEDFRQALMHRLFGI